MRRAGRATIGAARPVATSLKGALAPGNVDKTMAAPVTAILGHDTKFYDLLPRLFPHADAKAWFEGNEAFANDTAYKNGTLQVAYFILALRAVGLDTGPMSGFDNASVDAEFFPGGQIKSNVRSTSATAILQSCSHAAHDWNSPRSRRTSERWPRHTSKYKHRGITAAFTAGSCAASKSWEGAISSERLRYPPTNYQSPYAMNFGESRSSRQMFQYISRRIRSATALTTSAPSCDGST
jgi:hypothetical protein